MRLSLFIYTIAFIFCSNLLLAQKPVNDTVAVMSSGNSQKILIENILITGNKKTKPYIILREMVVKKGDLLDTASLAAKLERSRELVFNTALFVDVSVYATNAQTGTITVHVDVKERWYLFPLPYFKLVSRNFNDWWVTQKHSLDRVNYGIKFMQSNFTGQNDNLNVWLINGYNTQITVRYTLPFFDKKLKSGFSVGYLYSTQKEVNYNDSLNKQLFVKSDNNIRKISRVDLTYSFRPNQCWRHYIRAGYNYEWTGDTVLKLNPTYNVQGVQSLEYPELSYTFQYVNFDYNAYPTHGLTYDGTIYKRGITPTTNLWQLNAHALYAIPLNSKSFIRLEGAASIRFPDQNAYNNNRFFGFGNFQMHGLEYYVVSGTSGAIGRFAVHRQVAKYVLKNPFKSKTHDKIPFRFYLKAFGDAGYAYNANPGNGILNNKLLRSYGVGLDIVSIYDFVFKIDFSFNQLGQQGLYLHTNNDF